jgi:hypothetical protein
MVGATCVQASDHEPGSTRSALAASRPPRVNFAGVCLRCDERDCESPECVAWHEASCWMVCPRCGGRCWSETLEPCGCMFGVVEAWPESADAGRLAAV